MINTWKARRYTARRMKILAAFAEIADARFQEEQEMRAKLDKKAFAEWMRQREKAYQEFMLESIISERNALNSLPQPSAAWRLLILLWNTLENQTSTLIRALKKFAGLVQGYSYPLVPHESLHSPDEYSVRPSASGKGSN